MIPDLEALLRGVPCARCGKKPVDHPVKTPTGATCWYPEPDFAAMAAAVRAAEEEDDEPLSAELGFSLGSVPIKMPTSVTSAEELMQAVREDHLTTISMLTQERNVATIERDALRADLAQARAAGEELRNYKARVGLRHETCDAEVARLRATILRAQRVLIASRASDTDLALVRGDLSAALAPPPTGATP